MSTRLVSASRPLSYVLPLLLVLGLILRGLRLAWQPLWWDEGYSVYFATEPVMTLVRLTAQDIHPPLYYLLLRGWLLLWGQASPLALRTFSLFVGMLAIPVCWWLARILFPRRPRIALLATLLLAANPMHIFYSQEVRMYGLEMLLGMLSTGFFWQVAGGRWLRPGGTRGGSTLGVPEVAGGGGEKAKVAGGGGQESRGREGEREEKDGRNTHRALDPTLGYALTTVALLYTEYYAALLPLAHFIWALWRFRSGWQVLRRLIWVDAVVVLAYLPWLLYAGPKLVPYISQKIVSDADRPLGVLAYAWRHLLAFTAGHVATTEIWLRWGQFAGVVVVVFLAIVGGSYWLFNIGGRSRRTQISISSTHRQSQSSLQLVTVSLLFPAALAFALNLRLPFFPEGGERVLLFVLPYFLLWVVLGLDHLWRQSSWTRAGALAGVLGLLLAAEAGIWAFYTVPRYVDNDYRALIRQTVQQGGDTDTVFAVFPWQVGYWRAYAPTWGRGELHGPWPVLSPNPAWDESVSTALDAALAQGKIWFPEHLSLGGLLEERIEVYLRERALNFVDQWYSTTTLLSAWAPLPAVAMATSGADVDFGPVRLDAQSAVGPDSLVSANQVLALTLDWTIEEPAMLPLRVSLRLLDAAGHVWTHRDFYLEQEASTGQGSERKVGLLVPPGVPPGTYQVAVGVGPIVDDPWLFPVRAATGTGDTVSIGSVEIRPAEKALPPLRLPIQQPLADPVEQEGIAFLGFSGYDPDVATLAGSELVLSLFVQSRTEAMPPVELYVSLLDDKGEGVAGWEGWPLPGYPASAWRAGALVRLPVSFYLPAALSPGQYQLIAGLLDPVSREKTAPVPLGELPVTRRAIQFEAPTPEHILESPVQVDAHARLRGYDLARTAEGTALELTLYWDVLQTLLPPHHVFVHLARADGTILDQDDGVPGRRAVAAPSGTWLPGEVIVDPHRLALPSDLPAETTIRVGFYVPKTWERRPVFMDDQLIGDFIVLPLEPN